MNTLKRGPVKVKNMGASLWRETGKMKKATDKLLSEKTPPTKVPTGVKTANFRFPKASLVMVRDAISQTFGERATA